ncbi:MAG: aldo/keto reductase [Firmicutes bacterium]|nr:aldo/keto reductase [Bacillota bacterium]
MEKIRLGKTGLKVSKVGFGVLTMGATQLNLPLDEGAELIRYAMDKGINLFDTAQYYKTYKYLRKALDGTNYEPIISSKCLKPSYEQMTEAIEEARRELNRDVIDIFMLHELISVKEYNFRAGALEALVDAKAKGWIRHIGVSTHYVDVAEMIADKIEIEILFPLINYKGLGIRDNRNFDGVGTSEAMAAAIKKAALAGKGVFGMKAFGGGNLTGTYRTALDYVYGLPGISAMMIGFGKKREIDDIVSYLDGTMLRDYTPDISKKRIFIDQGDCEGCNACVQRCPSKAIFVNENGLAEVNHDICLTCGYCAPVCPARAIIMIDKRKSE